MISPPSFLPAKGTLQMRLEKREAVYKGFSSNLEPIKKEIYKPRQKSLDVWENKDSSKYRLLGGSVRSSKSYTADTIAIKEIQEIPNPNAKIILSGYSISSIARNVLDPWREAIDPYNKKLFRNVKEGKDDYLAIDWRGLKGKKFYIRGAGKENDYKAVQGVTVDYWYADEVTRHCESFVDMMYSRLSRDHSKAIWTYNPDSPFHYIKKRFLDNPALYHKNKKGFSAFQQWHFELKDNPSLSQTYIDSLDVLYSGLFHDRYVNGLWVLADGSVYDFFDKRFHTIGRYTPKAQFYVVGCDYGTKNPCCFLLFGVNLNTTPKIWCEREYYYDSSISKKQKTDQEYSAELKRFLGYTGTDYHKVIPRYIIVDPSAASFKVQLARDGFHSVKDAENSVVDGIRVQSSMLKSGQYLVGLSCPQTIADYAAYIWDEKKGNYGEDAPVKKNDHTKDTERYVLNTLFGKNGDNYKYLSMW